MARTFEEELLALEAAALRRRLRVIDSPAGVPADTGGRTLLNFSSNDYLGLAGSGELRAALKEGVDRFGAGSGASRLVCGTQRPHVLLEEAIAAFKETESALTFSSGYAAAVGTLTAVAQKGDLILLDKLCHASLIDGARLSGAAFRIFPHNRTDRLAALLEGARGSLAPDGRIIIVTESVFSMDGDRCPLAEIAALKEEHGALLMLDEAHAVGVTGPGGRGLAHELALAGKVEIHLGTLSKAIGLQGGYIAGSRSLTDLLTNRARSFIYSTAPPPCVAWAARTAVQDLLPGPSGEERRVRLWRNIRLLGTLPARTAPPPQSAILPYIIGSEDDALACSARLLADGFLVPAIRYPTVARGAARLRITLSASHTENEIRQLAAALEAGRLENAGIPPDSE